MYVPTMVKIPEPITAPIPNDVRVNHPRDFFNRTSAFSESDSSWSIFLQRKSCDPTHALRSRPAKTARTKSPGAVLRSESEPQFTPRRCIAQPPRDHSSRIHTGSSDLLELSVALDKLFGPAPRKTDGKAAIFILAFHAHDRSHAVIWMAHFSSQQRIRIGIPLCRRPPEGARTRYSPGRRSRLFLFATDTANKFLPPARVFRISLFT